MNIKITDKALRYFLDAPISPDKLAHQISLCGPTFDRITKTGSDYLYDIEIITNRVDTASAQGVARDSVAILNQQGIKAKLKNDPYKEKVNLYPHLPKTFSFDFEDKSLVSRLVAVSLENITIKESPQDTQTLLNLCGERSINNAVDITNELTLLYGMPSHIFDLDKLAAQKLTVRESKPGEEIITLDNQKNILKGGDIVIEDGNGRLVDLCDIMGGVIAEVDEYTKNILFMVPVFDAKRVRRSSLYLQKRTIASQIFEKLPDTELCLPTLTAGIKLFSERTGAKVSSIVFDSHPQEKKQKTITLSISWSNNIIGIDISKSTYISILKSLGFAIKSADQDSLLCTVPSWRQYDINIKEDLVEEVARVYGYFKLPSVIPCSNLPPEPKNTLLKTESKIKNYLSDRGYNEIYNNSLISLELIKKSDLLENRHLKLVNALSVDYEYLRTTLVPSLLQNIKDNQGKSEEPFFLYELSNTYLKTKDKLPAEISMLVMATTTDYRQAKGYLESLLNHLNLSSYKFLPAANAPKYFSTKNTAEIVSNGKIIGYLGLIKPAILHNFSISSNPVIAEFGTQDITDNLLENFTYHPISEYPEVIEQITVHSTDNLGNVIEKIRSTSTYIKNISYTSSFKENHSFKVSFSSPKNNLTQATVNDLKAKILEDFK